MTIKEICSKNGDKLVFVNIKKSYEALLKNDEQSDFYRKDLKECTQMYWSVKSPKFEEATHILGCYHGVVKSVLKIEERKVKENEPYKSRKIFDGVLEEESPYIGKDIRKVFDTLANFIHPKYYGFED